jgi:dTDP-4-dehydrorhamnose 3,5-epimerase-like enzyme
MKINLFESPVIGDERGALVALEAMSSQVPFEIKRVYYIFGTRSKVRRGLHAHKELQQVAFCVSGSCKLILDDGKERREILLDHPGKGLFIDRMIWREMFDFSPDCVLMVLANMHFEESDYIRNYQLFLEALVQS